MSEFGIILCLREMGGEREVSIWSELALFKKKNEEHSFCFVLLSISLKLF